MTGVDHDVLAHPVWAALGGPHTSLGVHHGAARRYRADVAAFGDVDPADPEAGWRDLAALHPGAGPTIVFGARRFTAGLPAGWTALREFEGLQLVAGDVVPPPRTHDVRALEADDLPDMLDLVARTEPGPFAPGALRMGRFLGIRRDGRLVAMAGERLRLPGWVEISAVCTDGSVRGQGLASALVAAVVEAVRARGDDAFLHVAAHNTGALRVYERLGFTVRRPMWFAGLRFDPPR